MFKALRQKIFGVGKSGDAARSRLQFVLVQDRTGLTSDEMANFKHELVDVIERYFLIDKQAFGIDYKRDGETTTLFINSPVIVRRQDAPFKDSGARKHKSGQRGDRDKQTNDRQNSEKQAGNAGQAIRAGAAPSSSLVRSKS